AVGAYLVTAVVAAAAIVWLRRLVSPIELRDFLGFFFIAAIAAGLEPATVKAAVLRDPAEADAVEAAAPALLGACAVKALAAAPLLAISGASPIPTSRWPT
ncbi:MAG: hypothetical protein ACR2FH_06425, partial [Caulobacteraceae bacterium]